MAGAFSGEAAKNIPIDSSSVESLPESLTSSKNFSDVDMSMSVPVVDLQDPNAMEAIGLACEEWGVFQLKNHGVPLSLLKEVDDEIKHFSLSHLSKRKKAQGLLGASPAMVHLNSNPSSQMPSGMKALSL
ncbi:hypothetical protein K1719_028825 [Acacia pycnantha]|nr:hypothetical protein K1719_028825 [Acacia pycnantha]